MRFTLPQLRACGIKIIDQRRNTLSQRGGRFRGHLAAVRLGVRGIRAQRVLNQRQRRRFFSIWAIELVAPLIQLRHRVARLKMNQGPTCGRGVRFAETLQQLRLRERRWFVLVVIFDVKSNLGGSRFGHGLFEPEER